jgi:hypothetical protein
VVRAMEVYRDRLIAYSLGNFATYGRFNLSGPQSVSAVLDVALDGDGKWLGGRLLPVRLVDAGIPAKDNDKKVFAQVTELSQSDFPESGLKTDATGLLRR